MWEFPRFTGVRTFARLPHVSEWDGVDFAVVGFPFDTGTSFRTGQRFGPEAVRSASVLLRPYHPIHEVEIFDVLSGVDGGDLPVRPGDTGQTLSVAQATLDEIVGSGVLPVVIGGDHTVTLVQLRSLAARFGPLGVVHLDAHGDVWSDYWGQRYFHGTTFRRAAEEGLIRPGAFVQAGLRGTGYGAEDMAIAESEFGFVVQSIDELRELGPIGFGDLVRSTVGDAPVFVTFDVDVCDPAFAPGTGTPEIGGLTSSEALSFVRQLTGIRIVGADVVETCPPYDNTGNTTALLAANIAWELISLVALRPEWRDTPVLSTPSSLKADNGTTS